MSASGENQLDTIIVKFIEEYDRTRRISGDIKKHGVADVFGFLHENKLLPQLVTKAKKSDRDSEKLRAAGNAAFKMKDFEEARSKYMQAICCAELKGEPMALAYANRSAVHYELQEYDDAIKDVNHALDTGNYPDELKHKLFERRAKSYLALSKYQTALEEFKKAILYSANIQLGGGGVTNNGNPSQENAVPDSGNLDLEKILDSLKNGDVDGGKTLLMNGIANREKALRVQPLVELIAECIGKSDFTRPKPKEPKLSHKASKNSKGRFPALEIAVSPEMGKHVVASANIAPGDVLAVEKPYLSVLIPEFHYSFCDYCKKRCHASVPCPNCNNVVFCSEKCQRQSWDTHHSIECDLLPTLKNIGCKVNILIGIRGLIKATKCGKDLQIFVDEHVNVSKATHRKFREKEKSKTNVIQTSDYHLVHNLVTHEEDRSEVQMLSVMATVCCIIHIIRGATTFFGNLSTQATPLDAKHIVAANLISRYFMMAGCNAFEIRESGVEPSREFENHEPKIIGGALYPTLCLFNHSCDPDVTAYMLNEETRVVFAIKPLRRSEQVFISYGPEYIHNSLSARQKDLQSKYFFTCRCPACSHDWPLADNLPEYPIFISHKVESTQGPRIFDACRKLPELLLAADEGRISQEQMELAAQFLSLYHKYVNRPWKYYFAAQRVIRQYFNYTKNQQIG